MKTTLKKTDLTNAVENLKDTERGRQALRNLLAFIEDGGDGLDIVNQDAVNTILLCQFGPFAGSTREEIRRAVGKRIADTSADPRVVIVLDGGLVQDVISDVPMRAVVLDYDIEGADQEDLTPIPQREGCTQEAWARNHAVEVFPGRVDQIHEAIEKHENKTV